MRIKMVVSYDGSKFNGFQRLNNGTGVQNVIEDALLSLYGYKILIKGAGRTDAKVHANYQVVAFDVDKFFDDLGKKLNKLLNPNIIVKSVKKTNDDFHPRLSVKKKEYVYKINLGSYKAALNDYFLQIPYKIDISLMRDASIFLLGTHDFRNFISGEKNNYVTTINSIRFVKRFDKLEIHFVGPGFYRYMIRNLVGALLEVGKCRITASVINDMLTNLEKKQSLPTAGPQGLYLNKIWY